MLTEPVRDKLVILVASEKNSWAINDLFLKNLKMGLEDNTHILFARPGLVWEPFENGKGPDVIFLPDDQIHLLRDVQICTRSCCTKIVILKQNRDGGDPVFSRKDENLYFLKLPVYSPEIKDVMKELEVQSI